MVRFCFFSSFIPVLARPNFQFNKKNRTRINEAIRAKELRVIGAQGENLGVITVEKALKAAEEAKMDLIEISPKAKPPVAKIMDFGQYRYDKKRKDSEVKANSHTTETKNVQVKIGTGDHDQQLKAKRISEWLNEGHRVKVDLFLWGRYKYMEEAFLKERLERFLKIIPADYKLADEIKKSPKGFSCVLERQGKTVKGPKILDETDSVSEEHPEADKSKEKEENSTPIAKSKKKSLDELLESGMI